MSKKKKIKPRIRVAFGCVGDDWWFWYFSTARMLKPLCDSVGGFPTREAALKDARRVVSDIMAYGVTFAKPR